MADPTLSPASDVDVKGVSKPTLTPPASEDADKQDDSGSELSDLEGDGDDNDEIVPDHYYEGGKIPVFKPVSLPLGTCLPCVARDITCSRWSYRCMNSLLTVLVLRRL